MTWTAKMALYNALAFSGLALLVLHGWDQADALDRRMAMVAIVSVPIWILCFFRERRAH